MHIRDIISQTKDIGRFDTFSILSFVLAMSKEEILAKAEKKLNSREVELIDSLMEKRRLGTPIAYLTNEREFFSERFFIDENVLIPRPETELLVEEALAILGKRPYPQAIIDIGTGSGIIGIMIAKKTKNSVICADISYNALRVASFNAMRLGIKERVIPVCSDLLDGIKTGNRFDMILANLPYISEEEWAEVVKDVRDFEPFQALYGGKDGLWYYKRLLKSLPTFMKKDAWIICEVGGKRQAEELKTLMDKEGLTTYIKKDYSDTERIVAGQWISL